LEIGDTAGWETCATGQGDIFIEQRAENSLREKQRCGEKRNEFSPRRTGNVIKSYSQDRIDICAKKFSRKAITIFFH
jgi:hypothetical protein